MAFLFNHVRRWRFASQRERCAKSTAGSRKCSSHLLMGNPSSHRQSAMAAVERVFKPTLSSAHLALRRPTSQDPSTLARWPAEVEVEHKNKERSWPSRAWAFSTYAEKAAKDSASTVIKPDLWEPVNLGFLVIEVSRAVATHAFLFFSLQTFLTVRLQCLSGICARGAWIHSTGHHAVLELS
jgi:hypothetical protein